MSDDQAKAIDAIKAKFPARITSFDGLTYSVHRAIDEVVSILCASRGSEGTEVADALERALLLATPVTITMEECAMIGAGFHAMYSDGKGAVRSAADSLLRVLGDRIQISGQSEK